MRKMTLVLAGFAALSAGAEPKPVGYLQIADEARLAAAAAKFGENVGQPTLGLTATAVLSQTEFRRAFGMTATNSSVLVTFCLDEELVAKGNLDDLRKVEAAIVYPLSKSKGAIVKSWNGFSEMTNGLYHVNGAVPGASLLDDFYAGFSDDGKYIAICDKPEYVRPSLGMCKSAEKPMKDALVRFRASRVLLEKFVTKENVAAWVTNNLDDAGKTLSKSDLEVFDLLSGLRGLSGELAYSDLGLDIRATIDAAEGSGLSRLGKNPLAPNALAFAPAESVVVQAVAAGGAGASAIPAMKELEALLVRHGIKTGFLAKTEKPGSLGYTLDVQACADYFKLAATNELSKIDPNKFVDDLKATIEKIDSGYNPETVKPFGVFFGIKGFSSGVTPAARLAKILPEMNKTVKPFACAWGQPYAAIRQVAPMMVATLDESARAMVEPIVNQLPVPGEGGVGCMYWRENSRLHGLYRMTNDELKGLGSVFNAFVAFQMASAMGNAGFLNEEDDEDEEDEDDDDEE